MDSRFYYEKNKDSLKHNKLSISESNKSRSIDRYKYLHKKRKRSYSNDNFNFKKINDKKKAFKEYNSEERENTCHRYKQESKYRNEKSKNLSIEKKIDYYYIKNCDKFKETNLNYKHSHYSNKKRKTDSESSLKLKFKHDYDKDSNYTYISSNYNNRDRKNPNISHNYFKKREKKSYSRDNRRYDNYHKNKKYKTNCKNDFDNPFKHKEREDKKYKSKDTFYEIDNNLSRYSDSEFKYKQSKYLKRDKREYKRKNRRDDIENNLRISFDKNRNKKRHRSNYQEKSNSRLEYKKYGRYKYNNENFKKIKNHKNNYKYKKEVFQSESRFHSSSSSTPISSSRYHSSGSSSKSRSKYTSPAKNASSKLTSSGSSRRNSDTGHYEYKIGNILNKKYKVNYINCLKKFT